MLRIERYVNFGAGVSEARAAEFAEDMIARDADPGWFGQITVPLPYLLTEGAVPQAGENLQLTGYRGVDLLLHLVQVRINWRQLTAHLWVDTKARDMLTLYEMWRRNLDSNISPAKRLMRGSTSATVQDISVPWDVRSGSGFVPLHSLGAPAGATPTSHPDAFIHCAANQWTVTRVVAAEKASVRQFALQAFDETGNPKPVPFWVSILDAEPAIGVPEEPPELEEGEVEPPYLPANPVALGEHPRRYPNGEIEGWGTIGQRAGYSPGSEENGDPPTGRLVDDGTWQIHLEPGQAHLWVAIWPDGTDGFFQGRMYHGVQ
jgi:hypothetical protein